MELPTWSDANARDDDGSASALDRFISVQEPAGKDGDIFRRQLLFVLITQDTAIQNEIEWCKREGGSENVDYVNGFMAGLRQSRTLLNLVNRTAAGEQIEHGGGSDGNLNA